MRHRLLSFAGCAALAAAAFLSAGPAYAQHRGGHSGGAYSGGYRGGYGGHYGGYGHYYGGHYGGYGYGYPGFGLYIGLGGLGYGGYYPGYYGGGYAPGYYGYDPAYAVPPANYRQPYAGPVQTQSAYPPSTTAARLVVRVPANAKLWIDDYQSTQTGPVRELTTPATLEPGRPYHYTLKAQWDANGQPVTQERTVEFQAGQTTTVDFTQLAAMPAGRPPATTPPASPVPATTPPPPAATPPSSPPPAN